MHRTEMNPQIGAYISELDGMARDHMVAVRCINIVHTEDPGEVDITTLRVLAVDEVVDFYGTTVTSKACWRLEL
jgi:hypothetical protein